MDDREIPPPAEDIDNVLLLSADSLRADRVHARRNDVPLTPNLDALAEDALEFRRGISPGPSTRDTIPSMLTGAYPSAFDEYGLPSPDARPLTLAEHLSDEGFATAGFSHNNFTSRRYNVDRGFDHFDDVSVEARKENDRGAWRITVRNLIEDTPLMELAKTANDVAMEWLGRSLFLRNEGGDRLTDRALEWLSATDGRRFLWLHYMDTHHPYVSPPEIQRQYGRVFSRDEIQRLSQKTRSAQDRISEGDVPDMEYVYDCTVRFVDEQIGRLVDRLEAEGELENSMIVVTGDHGEGFGEHGKFGHAHELWDTLICVPLIVYHPAVDGGTVEGQAPVRALVDTVVEGTGVFELADGGADYVVAEIPDYRDGKRCIRSPEYKLVEDDDGLTATRLTDEGETVIDPEEIPDDTRAEMEDRLDLSYETRSVDVDVDTEEFREDLAALGYLDE